MKLSGPPRVGRYGVDLAAFEALALPALGRSWGGRRVFLVDELGKMELVSERFRGVARLLDESVPVVATVQQKPHPFVTRLNRRAEIETLPGGRGWGP